MKARTRSRMQKGQPSKAQRQTPAMREANFGSRVEQGQITSRATKLRSLVKLRSLARFLLAHSVRGVLSKNAQSTNKRKWQGKYHCTIEHLVYFSVSSQSFSYGRRQIQWSLLFKSLSVRLVAYLSLVVAAAASLVVTHNWVLSAESSLVPSFFYSLTTLFLAIGSWGVAKTSVAILVEPKQRLFCYATIATITLICTIMYALDTRHNVLLDIASCATTLGLTSDEHQCQNQCCDEEQGC